MQKMGETWEQYEARLLENVREIVAPFGLRPVGVSMGLARVMIHVETMRDAERLRELYRATGFVAHASDSPAYDAKTARGGWYVSVNLALPVERRWARAVGVHA